MTPRSIYIRRCACPAGATHDTPPVCATCGTPYREARPVLTLRECVVCGRRIEDGRDGGGAHWGWTDAYAVVGPCCSGECLTTAMEEKACR